MSHKSTYWVVASVVISVLVFVTNGVIGLMLDNDQPHPVLDPIFHVLRFPAIYFPGWDSWDSRTATMSFRTWSLYSNFGDIFNAIFWGFGIGSLLYFVGRCFTSKHDGVRNDDA
ncbi:MAG TPA: hypothetical protein VN765_16045 [Candidatus Acidoferrum sp.]|nr:hypothetical protein [Candidatus Acidoferrum sp.]